MINYGMATLGPVEARGSDFHLLQRLTSSPLCLSSSPCVGKVKEAINRVYSMGLNESGQLGIGTFGKPQAVPMAISFFDNHKLLLLAAGGSHSIAVTDNHRIFTWGSGDRGELGTPRHLKAKSSPQAIALPSTSTDPAAAASAATSNQSSLSPRIRYIAAGLNNTFVLTEDFKCYGWGWNYLAELSLGHSNMVDAPIRCPFFDGGMKVRNSSSIPLVSHSSTYWIMFGWTAGSRSDRRGQSHPLRHW